MPSEAELTREVELVLHSWHIQTTAECREWLSMYAVHEIDNTLVELFRHSSNSKNFSDPLCHLRIAKYRVFDYSGNCVVGSHC